MFSCSLLCLVCSHSPVLNPSHTVLRSLVSLKKLLLLLLSHLHPHLLSRYCTPLLFSLTFIVGLNKKIMYNFLRAISTFPNSSQFLKILQEVPTSSAKPWDFNPYIRICWLHSRVSAVSLGHQCFHPLLGCVFTLLRAFPVSTSSLGLGKPQEAHLSQNVWRTPA